MQTKDLRDKKIPGQDGVFQIGLQLGRGAFGHIFMGLNCKTNSLCALKLESTRSKHQQLLHEAKILEDLKGGVGMPTMADSGTWDNAYHWLALELLGPSLEDLFNMNGRRFSVKTVLMIMDQMIARMQFLHSKSYIHRDVKPDNFLIGLGRRSNIFFMIDYGLSKRYRDPQSHQHIPYREDQSLTGTARYAAINSHLGIEQSRRDDMEGLGYILIYLIKGFLPWQGIKANNKQEKYHKIMIQKIKIPPEVMCKCLPIQIVFYMNYIHSLQFEDKPDYRFLRKLMRELFFNQGYDWDYSYDWTLQTKKDGSVKKNIRYKNHFTQYTVNYNGEQDQKEESSGAQRQKDIEIDQNRGQNNQKESLPQENEINLLDS